MYNIQGEPFGDPQGVKLLNITANAELKALSVQIETNQNGSFRIELPWNVIRAMGLDRDADFIVLIDGEQVQRGIATSPENVILAVEFEKGTRQIMIGDSRIIPEFGMFAITVIAVGMLGAIIVFSRLGFPHRSGLLP